MGTGLARASREDRGVPSSFRGGRHGICRTAGSRWAAPITRDPVGLSPGPNTSEQRPPVPADPPTVEEIIAVMRAAGDARGHEAARGDHLLWRAGLRISEALALAETDLDSAARFWSAGKGGRGERSGWTLGMGGAGTWLAERAGLPAGALFCVIDGPTTGRVVGLRGQAAAASPGR